MDWAEERYVRLYVYDTPEFLAMSWQARGLFALILRKVNALGVLQLSKLGLKHVALSVHGQWVDVESPLRELLDDGCIVHDVDRNVIEIPNFVAAQEAKQSDAARKRRSRSTLALTKKGVDGFVYVVRGTTTNRIKIGWSTTWESRVRGLVTSVGEPMEVLLVLHGTVANERAYHERFATYRIGGEWFTTVPEILSWVGEMSGDDVRGAK